MFFRSNIVFLFVLIAFEILFLAFSITQFNQVSTYVPFNVKNTNLSMIYFYIFIFIVTDSILIYFTKSSASYYKIKTENEMLEYQNKLQTPYLYISSKISFAVTALSVMAFFNSVILSNFFSGRMKSSRRTSAV